MAVSELELTDRQTQEPEQIVQVNLDVILPNPINPREEVLESDCEDLAASIRENGVLEPLLITPIPGGKLFYAVAGHRRCVGGRLAGLIQVPCIIRQINEEQQLDLMMVENIQRENLKPIQEARGFQRMLVAGRTTADIMLKLGLPRTYVEARLDILRLDKSIQQLFELDLLPVGAAPILALARDPAQQRHFGTLAVQRQLPLAKLEQIIREATNRPKRVSRPRDTARRAHRRKVLGEYEVFTRSEALHELEREGTVPFAAVAEAFNDICDGLCVEDDGGKAMCEACPAPRLIASLLRRTGVEIKGRKATAG